MPERRVRLTSPYDAPPCPPSGRPPNPPPTTDGSSSCTCRRRRGRRCSPGSIAARAGGGVPRRHRRRAHHRRAADGADHLVARWAVRGDQIHVVAGHFPLCTTELLPVEFTTFTVLREPVERTLSYLRHHRLLVAEDRDKPLEEIYDDPLRFHGMVHNHMVKMFSLTTDEMTSGMMTHVEFTPDRLARAEEQLATVDVVGLQEDFDGFCDELEARFGWDLGEPVVANTTAPTDVPPALVDRIVEDNALDVELYDFARRLVSERAGTGLLR